MQAKTPQKDQTGMARKIVRISQEKGVSGFDGKNSVA
jgi:hypothetical protein